MALKLTGALASGVGPINPGQVSTNDPKLTPEQRALLTGNVRADTAQQKVIEDATAKVEPPAEGPPATNKEERTKTYCPRCGWDCDVHGGPEITKEDRDNFRRAVIRDSHFTKEFSLFGDALRVTFRTLTAEEETACMNAVIAAMRTGELLTEGDGFREITDNRYCLAVVRIWREGEAYDAPTDDRPPDVRLKEARQMVFGKFLKTGPARHAVRLVFNDFTMMTRTMEVRAYDPNFWQAGKALA